MFIFLFCCKIKKTKTCYITGMFFVLGNFDLDHELNQSQRDKFSTSNAVSWIIIIGSILPHLMTSQSL